MFYSTFLHEKHHEVLKENKGLVEFVNEYVQLGVWQHKLLLNEL